MPLEGWGGAQRQQGPHKGGRWWRWQEGEEQAVLFWQSGSKDNDNDESVGLAFTLTTTTSKEDGEGGQGPLQEQKGDDLHLGLFPPRGLRPWVLQGLPVR